MTDSVRVRPARRSDREPISALLKELGYPEGVDTNTMFWVMNHPEIDIFVAVDAADRPIGFMSLSHRPQLRLRGRITTIDEMVVSESWRGKGVGRKLLAAAADRAKAMSAKRVELTTGKSRESYQRGFYTKNGFVEIDSGVFRLKDLEK